MLGGALVDVEHISHGQGESTFYVSAPVPCIAMYPEVVGAPFATRGSLARD